MMFWLVMVLMTAAAIFAVLWPLARRTPLRSGSDIAVYRDQLDEIERDRAAGLIGEREAEAARIEVARRLLGPNATREADLGEAITGAQNGIVTAEAKAAFDRAVALDPSDIRARYFLGLAAEQDGRPKEAAAIWRALLAEASADAGWAGFVRESLVRVDPAAAAASQPGPSADDVA